MAAECRVCWEPYEEIILRPRTLPCGHTFCTKCINKLHINSTVKCPTCKTDHEATKATQFPVNYLVEEIIANIAEAPANPLRPRHKRSKELTDMLHSLLRNQEDIIHKVDLQYDKTEEQLNKYEARLEGWLEKHLQLADELKRLQERNSKEIKELCNERVKLQGVMEEAGSRKKERQRITKRLTSVTTTGEAMTAVDDVDANNTATKEWLADCQQLFPDVTVAYHSRQVLVATTRGLKVMNKKAWNDDDLPAYLQDSTLSIIEKVDKIAEINWKTTLTAEDLLTLGKAEKAMLEAGRVVGVQKHQDHQRCSRLTYSNSRLHIHSLVDQSTPHKAITVQHGAVMGLIDPVRSKLVFLELAWGGSRRPKGKVYIRLNPFSGLAWQFFLLCTGEKGFSYKTTNFLEVGRKGTSWEWVKGGDYGNGGLTLLQELDKNQEKRVLSDIGSVFTPSSWTAMTSAQFMIRTESPRVTHVDYVFGKVEEGLQTLKAAVDSNSNIQDVTIVDCGAVVDL